MERGVALARVLKKGVYNLGNRCNSVVSSQIVFFSLGEGVEL